MDNGGDAVIGAILKGGRGIAPDAGAFEQRHRRFDHETLKGLGLQFVERQQGHALLRFIRHDRGTGLIVSVDPPRQFALSSIDLEIACVQPLAEGPHEHALNNLHHGGHRTIANALTQLHENELLQGQLVAPLAGLIPVPGRIPVEIPSAAVILTCLLSIPEKVVCARGVKQQVFVAGLKTVDYAAIFRCVLHRFHVSQEGLFVGIKESWIGHEAYVARDRVKVDAPEMAHLLKSLADVAQCIDVVDVAQTTDLLYAIGPDLGPVQCMGGRQTPVDHTVAVAVFHLLRWQHEPQHERRIHVVAILEYAAAQRCQQRVHGRRRFRIVHRLCEAWIEAHFLGVNGKKSGIE